MSSKGRKHGYKASGRKDGQFYLIKNEKRMSIKLNQFEELLSAVKRFKIINFDEIEFETGKGLDIDLSDIFSTNEGELFVILSDGSIRKAIIHIVDISSWKKGYPKYPKFHIYNCETIEKMPSKRKKHRCKASGRTDGQFYLIKNEKEWYEFLKICRNCLKLYNNQFKKKETKQSFPLREWIENPMSGYELPKLELDICTVPNCYTESWRKISNKRKEQKQYVCQECGKDFSDKECKKFLHVHHIDADKRNNTRENLKVLCIECHCREPDHSHLKQNPMYKEWLRSKCFEVQNKK